MKTRIEWIDMARGLSIFLVVYGHNFPFCEAYIYSFHVPLFFFISGMFHPKNVNKDAIVKRVKTILVPYFFWAFALYIFWLVFGRFYGKTSEMLLSPLKNFLGIFYSQGGQEYMDWGIPLWFLPCIFLLFLFYSAIRRIPNKIISNIVLILSIAAGFLWSRITQTHLVWSIDVALVAMSFYAVGDFLKPYIIGLNKLQTLPCFLILLFINVLAFYLNTSKIDMYRSIYGNEFLFFISGICGSIAFLLVFKLLPYFSFFTYIGKHTILILATHLRMLTVIKFILLFVAGITVFEFSEIENFVLAVVQIIMILPIIWLINKYAPILDGKITKR